MHIKGLAVYEACVSSIPPSTYLQLLIGIMVDYYQEYLASGKGDWYKILIQLFKILSFSLTFHQHLNGWRKSISIFV